MPNNAVSIALRILFHFHVCDVYFEYCPHHVGRHSLSLLKILLIGYLIVVFIGQQLLHDSILDLFLDIWI